MRCTYTTSNTSSSITCSSSSRDRFDELINRDYCQGYYDIEDNTALPWLQSQPLPVCVCVAVTFSGSRLREVRDTGQGNRGLPPFCNGQERPPIPGRDSGGRAPIFFFLLSVTMIR
jgi:hypothetical protein